MEKIYERIDWKNYKSGGTPINEQNLNKMDYALDQLDSRVVGLAYYDERAAKAANKAVAAQNACETQAKFAQSYATGDANMRSGEETDNAKYYSEQADSSARRAETAAAKLETLDTKDATTTFTSSDVEDGSASEWTSVPNLESGEKHSSIFAKVSQMFKNIRYLYKILGTKDISAIGDGSVRGAISELNSSFEANNRYSDENYTYINKWFPVTGRFARYKTKNDSSETQIEEYVLDSHINSSDHDSRYYTESEIDSKISIINSSINGKAASNHNHSGVYQPAGSYASSSHTHDNRYYTEGEVNTLLRGKQSILKTYSSKVSCDLVANMYINAGSIPAFIDFNSIISIIPTGMDYVRTSITICVEDDRNMYIYSASDRTGCTITYKIIYV